MLANGLGFKTWRVILRNSMFYFLMGRCKAWIPGYETCFTVCYTQPLVHMLSSSEPVSWAASVEPTLWVTLKTKKGYCLMFWEAEDKAASSQFQTWSNDATDSISLNGRSFLNKHMWSWARRLKFLAAEEKGGEACQSHLLNFPNNLTPARETYITPQMAENCGNSNNNFSGTPHPHHGESSFQFTCSV